MRPVTSLAALVFLVASAIGEMSHAATPSFPQVKIDRVVAIDPGDWVIQVTAIGEDGRPDDLMEREVSVYIKEGGAPIRPSALDPVTVFDSGLAAPGYDGEMEAAGKADLPQAVVIVVATHADVPLGAGPAVMESIEAVLGGLKEDASVGVVFYGDRIQVLWSPDGARIEARDVNEYGKCLKSLRSTAANGHAAGDGEVDCGGLFDSPSRLVGLRAIPSGQGLFPRLFGIREDADVMNAARANGHMPIDARGAGNANESFATGALEAAVRMLAIGSEPGTSREIVLISDGRDGYLRVADVVSERASRSPSCVKSAKECGRSIGGPSADYEGGSKECTRKVLACAIPRVAAVMRSREDAVREYMTTLVHRLRAFDIRLSVVALPGTGEVGRARLEMLAVKGRGVMRSADSLSALASMAAQPLADELATSAVIRPGIGLSPNTGYAVAVSVDGRMSSGTYRFTSGGTVRFWSGPWNRARLFAIGRLGHGWGPVVLWTITILVALLAALVLWKTGKGIAGLVKKIGKKKTGIKPPRPRVPGMKRPG